MIEVFKSATAYAQELKDLGAVRETYSFHDALMCIANASGLASFPASHRRWLNSGGISMINLAYTIALHGFALWGLLLALGLAR